jgi:hypothetical protein
MKQKFCPRCGKVGVASTAGGFDFWNCPDHGVIWKEAVATVNAEPAKQPGGPQLVAAGKRAPRALNGPEAGGGLTSASPWLPGPVKAPAKTSTGRPLN